MKKSIFVLGIILLILINAGFISAGLIVDHNAVKEFNQYKNTTGFQDAIQLAKSTFHIGYGHTSHGSQITSGMTGLNTFMNNLGYPTDLFAWNNGGTGGSLDLEEGAGYGDGWLDHDCGYSGWDDETRYYLDGSDPGVGTADHSDVNVIMWSWCGQVDGVDIQNHYLDNMADLESEYPDVTFIYMTGHLEGHKTGDSWFDNNNAIRDWVSQSDDRILFDFSDLEKYDPDQEMNYADYFADDNCDYDSDGESPRNEDSNWATDWQNTHTQNVDWYSVSCAHSQSLNCNQKAKAFWWMMTKMVGWSAMPPEYDDCIEGEITEACYCNGTLKDSGFCCNEVWDENACLLIDYGFEDWTGDMYTTPDYPFSSNYAEYMDNHDNATTVVSSYNANEMNQVWLPHSGNFFLIQDDSPDYDLDPSIEGISKGTLNAHNNIGLNAEYGGNNDFDISTEITTGRIFVRYWIRANKGFAAIPQFPGVKWIRFATSDHNNDNRITINLQTDTENPAMLFWCTNEDGWLVGEGGPPYFNNSYDGNWHKYSFYVDWNDGIIRVWYDEENETEDNNYLEYMAEDNNIGTGKNPAYIVLKSNFCAHYPTEETYHAIDDIEVWDGMPSITMDEPFCGDGQCNGNENCTTCPEDCGNCTVECLHDADNNPCDGEISVQELNDYIDDWKFGQVSIENLMQAIILWKGGN